MNSSTGQKIKNKDIFYVVTRDGRRAWPKDYWTLGEAQDHANSLIDSLRTFSASRKPNVVIVETTDPERIN